MVAATNNHYAVLSVLSPPDCSQDPFNLSGETFGSSTPRVGTTVPTRFTSWFFPRSKTGKSAIKSGVIAPR